MILKIIPLFVLILMLSSCCPPFCFTKCHGIPDTDSVNPQARITIEYWDASGQPRVEKITSDRTINVTEDQRFNIIYSGTDNVGIKYLWLMPSWTQWPGGIPQVVTPMVAPKDFGDKACSPRSGSSKYTYEQARAYRFNTKAEDYHGNTDTSPTLRVIHGEPPGPLTP